MKLTDFRIGWRALIQEPAYTMAVLSGLGIGLAACLLLLGFVRNSLQYNAGVPDLDHVYLVAQHYNVDAKRPKYEVAPLFLRTVALNTPGVAEATSFLPARPEMTPLTVRVPGDPAGSQLRGLTELQGLTVLPGFAGMLGLTALQGDLASALERPDSFVLTEAAALRLFGSADVVGRSLEADGKPVRVGAVLRTPSVNTTMPFEALFGVNSILMDQNLRSEIVTGERGWMGKLLIRVRPGASLPAITAAFQQAVDNTPSVQHFPPEVMQRLGKRKAMDISLTPLRYAYFDHQLAGHGPFLPGQRADPIITAALASVALLILALAAINYANLATVRVLRRQREVAMRKVLGAGAYRLALHFLIESLLVSMAATALGLLLAWLLLPLFSQLMDRDLAGLLSMVNLLWALAIGAALGLVSAIYPVWVALRVHPSQALAGRPDSESVRSMRLRRALTVLQVAAAMGFAGVSMAIVWQTEFAMRSTPGFDAAPMLIVDLPEPVRFSKQARGFIAALSAQPGVSGVAISEDAVGRLNSAWTHELKRPGGQGVSTDMKSVSANFFEQYRIRPLAGRLFEAALDKEDDTIPMVLNAVAARELGFATPESALGEVVLFTGFDGKVVRKRIIGIAPDLRFYSLREAPRATAYELWTAGTTLSVRATAPPAQIERSIQQLWPSYFPNAILKTHRAADILNAVYADEARLARLLLIATGIALAIAAFGTYVLSANTVQRRAREIVLRKLHGAGRSAIALLVLREIGGLTLLASLIGLPLAALAIERYLASYAARAPIGGWTLLLALALTMAVAVSAVARQAWIAMRMMPAQALRG